MADATLLATDLLLSYPAASGATAFDRLARSRAAAPAAEAVLMTALRQARSTPDHGCTTAGGRVRHRRLRQSGNPGDLGPGLGGLGPSDDGGGGIVSRSPRWRWAKILDKI